LSGQDTRRDQLFKLLRIYDIAVAPVGASFTRT
jgi:hypothetical protein